MLLMSCLLYTVHWLLYSAVALTLGSEDLQLAFRYIHTAISVLLPVIGWVAESWLDDIELLLLDWSCVR